MVLKQTVSEWVEGDFALGAKIASFFEVFDHFAANRDEKFLDLLVGDGVEISIADSVARAREDAVAEQNMARSFYVVLCSQFKRST